MKSVRNITFVRHLEYVSNLQCFFFFFELLPKRLGAWHILDIIAHTENADSEIFTSVACLACLLALTVIIVVGRCRCLFIMSHKTDQTLSKTDTWSSCLSIDINLSMYCFCDDNAWESL